jgi:hypothetical protein
MTIVCTVNTRLFNFQNIPIDEAGEIEIRKMWGGVLD